MNDLIFRLDKCASRFRARGRGLFYAVVIGLLAMFPALELAALDGEADFIDAPAAVETEVEFPCDLNLCCNGDQLWWFQSDWLGYRGDPRIHLFGDHTVGYFFGNARAFYSNDLRYEFTGQESQFGVESSALASLVHQQDGWTSALTGELYLNQPFDRNVLTDYPLRESFSHNFDIDTVEISQLFVTANRNNWFIDFGKFVTPFGRYSAPQVSNARRESPFIRTESVLFRETGVQFRYQPTLLRLAAAITNGGSNRDTNSSKAIVARAGFDLGDCQGGASVKWHDGIGSERQKEFSNHAGVDFMIRRGRLTLSTELIYDEYGLRRPGFPLDDIDWGRSLYNRQLNGGGVDIPLTGWGWYGNAIWRGDMATTVFQYGEFHPNSIGDPIHDQTTRRISAKYIRRLGNRLDFYVSGVFENRVENAQDGRFRKGVFVLTGLQFNF